MKWWKLKGVLLCYRIKIIVKFICNIWGKRGIKGKKEFKILKYEYDIWNKYKKRNWYIKIKSERDNV